MGAKYERAYHSYHDCVITDLSICGNRRTSANSRLLCLERGIGRFVAGERKRTMRKADANKEVQYNREINNKYI